MPNANRCSPEELNNMVSEGFSQGLELAAKYLTRNFADLERLGAFDRLKRDLVEVLENHPEPLSERFIRLFSQLVATAECGRIAYAEEQLDDEKITRFLETMVIFFVGWSHP